MMKDWYEKSINVLQLNGKGERTQEAYSCAVRMLVEFYHKTPYIRRADATLRLGRKRRHQGRGWERT